MAFTMAMLACGGSNSTSGGGGGNTNTTTEILYASSGGNEIFTFSIDQNSGGLTQTASVNPGGETVNNTALAITPSGSFLYAVNDVSAGINGYGTDATGALSLMAGSPFPILPSVQPSWPVVEGMAIDSKGKFLYVGTNAGFGGVAGFTIDSTSGALTPIPGGPFSNAPDVPLFPIQIAIDPSGAFLYATDQLQSVWAFAIDSQTGSLAPVAGSPFEAGPQPYGLQVDPSGKFVYVALSDSSGIAGFAIDSTTGALTSITGSPFATSSMPIAAPHWLTITPSGKFLYAFNGTGSTMAAFSIDASTGGLSPLSGSPFATSPQGGSGLIIDPSGQFLYLAGVKYQTAAFVQFKIDADTGALTPTSGAPIPGTQQPIGMVVAKFQ